MTTQFRNLVFEGGGVKGIAQIGAMQTLMDNGYLLDIKRVAGTSSGAINALIFALGYSMEEQRELLYSKGFKEFLDDSWGWGSDMIRLARDFGWNKGDHFLEWIDHLIEKKLGKKKATFQDLKDAHKPLLYVTGSNLSTGYVEVFSAEQNPEMAICDALRISMSMPLYFAAVRHGVYKDCYADGGVILNYPVKIFDREKYIDSNELEAMRTTEYYDEVNEKFLTNFPESSPYIYNKQTLGLRVDTEREIAVFRYRYDKTDIKDKNKIIDSRSGIEKIDNFPDYLKALIEALRNAQENQHLHSDDWHRTLYIDILDVKTADFNIDLIKKAKLYQQGVDYAEKYLKWFEDPSKKVFNRIT